MSHKLLNCTFEAFLLRKKYYNDLRAKCVRSQANTIICTHRKYKQIKNGSALLAPLSRFFTHFDCMYEIKKAEDEESNTIILSPTIEPTPKPTLITFNPTLLPTIPSYQPSLLPTLNPTKHEIFGYANRKGKQKYEMTIRVLMQHILDFM